MADFTKTTYYAPYLSDNESDTSSVSSDSEDEFTPDAPRMEFGRGPTQMTYVPFANAKEQAPLTGTTKNPTSDSRNTNLIVISSRDRDTSVYPNPTFFTIRLPRVYRNISQINLTEIALLNSFFNFRADKGNLTLPLKESGRPAFNVNIRQGSYTADQLVSELNSALNQTPLFANIGFQAFKNQFKNTGDFTILFNEPNGQIFNYQTQQYDTATTKGDIVARYFVQNTAFGVLNFTNLQCLIAYYYPCIKEMVLRNIPFDLHETEYQALPAYSLYTNPIDYILFGFTGLDDPYIRILVQDSANLILFDAFHQQNTFLVYPVNQYVCSYDSRIGRFRITAPSINTSISSDISNQYNNFLNILSYNYGYNGLSDLVNSLNSNTNLKGVRLEFYNFIHKQFTDYFGINFGVYGADFFVDTNNQIQLYNTKDKLGWISDSNNLPDTFISSFPQRLPDVPVYWPNLKIPFSTVTDGFSTINFVSTYNLGTLNFPDSSEYKKGFIDLSFNIFPTTYARVLFDTPMRQTVDIMTIPRFENERFSTNQEIYKFGSSFSETPFLFSTPAGPILSEPFTSPDYVMYDISHVLFKSPDYMRFQGTQWLNYVRQSLPIFVNAVPSQNTINITSFRPHIFFRIIPATIHAIPNASYNIDIYVETQSENNFPVPLTLTYYKDRSAFMSDVQQDISGNYVENELFYFQSEEFSNTNSAKITVRVVNGQYGYFMVNIGENAVALPGNLPLRVFAVNSDFFSISSITSANDLDFRLLPWLSTNSQTQLYEDITPASDIFNDPLTYIFSTASDFFQLGYDSNNISNNFLDYMIQGTDNTYYDPKNIEDYLDNELTGLRYVLKLNEGGEPTPAPETTNWELYFPLGTTNTIEDTYTTEFLSTGATILTSDYQNEHTLVNWFNPIGGVTEYYLNSIPEGNLNYVLDYNISSISSNTVPVFQTCVNKLNPLQTDSYAYSNIENSGTVGIQFFLPPSEIVKLREMTLKFAYTSPTFRDVGATSPITRSLFYSQISSYGIKLSTFVVPGSFYTTQNSDPDADTVFDSWDDWYLPNRRNLKIGVFPTDQISSLHISSVLLENSIGTLTLNKICQVANYSYAPFNLRTREPDWGTYYTYTYSPTQKNLYDVATIDMYGDSQNWRSTVVGADYIPTFIDATGEYQGYFLTHSTINNYNNLPRNYGIADSVGYMMRFSSMMTSWMLDIPNSYTAIPFYYNESTLMWEVGSFSGLTYTTEPMVPTPSTLGANPYFGPMGHLQFTLTTASTFTINSTPFVFYTAPTYFNSKLTFEKLDNCYNPSRDLSSFGNISSISNELQDTRIFFYENLSTNLDYVDIYESTTKRMLYGFEKASNYLYRDDNSGYNFLSYLPNLTVRSSFNGSTCEYAVHVRAQVPTVDFTSGIRISGKNFTDFGLVSLGELVSEITQLNGYVPIGPSAAYSFLTTDTAVIYNSTFNYVDLIDNNNNIRYNSLIGNYFTHDYADQVMLFDRQFSVGTVTFGINLLTSYPGVSFTFNNFSTALSSYIGFYDATFSNFSTINGVYNEANELIQIYISTTYSGILPPQFIERARYTDPLTFQLLFSTSLVSPYNTAFDEWGLGWNLGFAKRDTELAVSHVSDTFIRIVADYLYLQLNQAYSMNGVSATEKENLALTREAMGQDRRYFAKIILNSFAGISRVAVQLPKEFSPPIQKFDTLEFQLVDKYGRPVTNSDCDSDMVLQVTEVRTDLTIKTSEANNIVT
jgi:hypothetical protein